MELRSRRDPAAISASEEILGLGRQSMLPEQERRVMFHEHILTAVIDAGGVPYQVGGSIRDELLGLPVKDHDIEVFHLPADVLARVLAPFGDVSEVGVSFGVIKLKTQAGHELDFTLPRRENKIGRGHRGFQVEVDHTMTLEESAARRDFSINSLYRDCRTHELFDPFQGRVDLEQRILRATSEHFAEDPLRVLRGFQFAARFGLTLEPATAEMCRSLREEYSSLPVERVWGEWIKWATKARHPGAGLEVLVRTGWIEFYPELTALIDVPQDPEWHPEGDAWVHTALVCDAAAEVAERHGLPDDERVVLMFAALCHDLGKAVTTVFEGRWKSLGHCEAGVPLSRQFLQRIGCPEWIIEQVEPLVAEHLVHVQHEITPRAVRRLSERLGKASITQLIRLVEADMNGRPPLPKGLPASAVRLAELSRELEVERSRPQPLLLGRHLIALGHAPDVWFREVLSECYQAQLDGIFIDEGNAHEFLKELMNRKADRR